jgi:uncharacterized protein RhaS with RHS repeats
LDEETGLYYYGARYYNPATSVWLSVDPIIKHHESPYSSFSNNPIILVDIDRRDTSFVSPAMKAEFDQTYKSIESAHEQKQKELSEAESNLKNSRNRIGKWFKQQKVNRLNREYNAIGALKQSFDDIINSEQKYLINALPNAENKRSGGKTTYRCDGVIEIKYYSGNTHSLVHEVRHGQGYLLKEWGVNQNGMYAVDYYDELAGFNAAADYLRLVKKSSFRSVYGDTTIDRLINEQYPEISRIETIAR